jgi:hypothetical protein
VAIYSFPFSLWEKGYGYRIEIAMPFKRILCGVDFSRDALRAYHTAVKLARQSKAALHLLHV